MSKMNSVFTKTFHLLDLDEKMEAIKYKYIILLFSKENDKKYLQFLLWDGKYLLFYLSNIDMSGVMEKWNINYPKHYITMDDLKKNWDSTSSFHQYSINMSEIFKGNMDEMHKILSFMFTCNTQALSSKLIKELVDSFEDRVITPITVMIINRPKSNL